MVYINRSISNKELEITQCKKRYKPLHICMFQIFGALELMLTNYKEAKNMVKFNYKMRTRKNLFAMIIAKCILIAMQFHPHKNISVFMGYP